MSRLPRAITDKRQLRRRSAHRRRGMALPLVLVCVMLIIAFAAALTTAVTVQHKQLRRSDRQQQACWLAESALQRAAARLQTAENYLGEQWQIPAAQLAQDEDGSVRITVAALPAPATGWLVTAEATYPQDAQQRVSVLRERALYRRANPPTSADDQAPDN